jgi:hypothetical protein
LSVLSAAFAGYLRSPEWVIRYRSLRDENRSMSATPRKRRLAARAPSVVMGQQETPALQKKITEAVRFSRRREHGPPVAALRGAPSSLMVSRPRSARLARPGCGHPGLCDADGLVHRHRRERGRKPLEFEVGGQLRDGSFATDHWAPKIGPIGITRRRLTLVPAPVPARGRYSSIRMEVINFSSDFWSEWQDLNLRPPRPERGAYQPSERR